ncbi:hypothetical protein BH24ACT1_BH24ACT1_09810 [soil metagenome]
MPTYEYVCRSCDNHLEVVQRFDEASLTDCPACGGALRKAFGNIGIVFKGSGFYKNDSRSVAKSGNGAGAKAGEGAKEAVKDSGGEGKDAGSGSSSEGTAAKAKDATSAAKDSPSSKPSDTASSSSKPPAKTA